MSELLQNQSLVVSEEQMAGGLPGEVGSIINRHLGNYIYPHKLGRVFNSQTDFELPKVGRRQPDVAFVSIKRLKVNVWDTVPVAPDLAVEVVSKTDDVYGVEDKVFEYLRAGVKLVWVVRPKHRLIEVYRPNDEKPTIFGSSDELDGADVIPGFKLKVSTIFDEIPIGVDEFDSDDAQPAI